RFHGQAREAESVHQREVLVLAPLADRRIALRAGHDRTAHQGEDGGEGMAPSVPTARIGDLGKEGKKAPSDGRFHATTPCNTSPDTGLSLRQVLLLFSQVQTVKSPVKTGHVA